MSNLSVPKNVLMCRPSAYGLHYEINAWMRLENKPDLDLARKQWEELYSVLSTKVGVVVELVEQAGDCPDMVFTANAGLVRDKNILLSHFRFPERQREEPQFAAYFLGQGYSITEISQQDSESEIAFEGEGDALRAGEFLVIGYGLRTDLVSHPQVAKFCNEPILSLELVDGRWYHLDTCFLPLGGNLVAFYPGAFSQESVAQIRKHFQIIEVREDEALRFACNAVVIHKTVVLPADCPQLAQDLQTKGYATYSVAMTEFIKAGGACKCLTLYL